MKKPAKKAAVKKSAAKRPVSRANAATKKVASKAIAKPAKKSSVGKSPARKSLVKGGALAKKNPSVKAAPKAAAKNSSPKKIVKTAPKNASKPGSSKPLPSGRSVEALDKKGSVHAGSVKGARNKANTKDDAAERLSSVDVSSPSPESHHRNKFPPKKPAGKVAHAIIRSPHEKESKVAVPKSPLVVPTTAPDLLENDEGANPGFFQTDEVFDETDYAQHLQLMEQADISRRARELNRPQVHPDFDGVHCVECDISIPVARLQAGRIRCVDCQAEIEDEEKRSQNLSKGR